MSMTKRDVDRRHFTVSKALPFSKCKKRVRLQERFHSVLRGRASTAVIVDARPEV